jgi:hypothetical protein
MVDGEADAVVGQQVTGDYFGVLGIRPVIGSVIEPRDERGSTPNRVVVLGHGSGRAASAATLVSWVAR